MRPPRVAFYGLGTYGQEALRIVHGYGWPIVAAWNRAGGKVGQDAGRVAGLNRDLGVVVEDCETADFAAAGADVCIVAVNDRLAINLPAYGRLFGAGINVICHGAEAYFPQGADAALAAEIDNLAKVGSASFTGTGIWDHSRLWAGVLAAGPATSIRSLFHRSTTDAESANVQLMRFVGVGQTQDQFAGSADGVAGKIGGLYKLIPHLVLETLGFTVTKVTERLEPVLSEKPVWCRLLEDTLAPGICLGTRIVAMVETREGVTAETHIELRILPDSESEHMVWEIDGTPMSKVRVDRTQAVHTSAACMVNRIPDVIVAAPGIRLVTELGPLKPKFL